MGLAKHKHDSDNNNGNYDDSININSKQKNSSSVSMCGESCLDGPLCCRSTPPLGSALGFRVVAAPLLQVSQLGPGGEPAVARCRVNCCRWQPRGLQEGTVPSRGLMVRLRTSVVSFLVVSYETS